MMYAMLNVIFHTKHNTSTKCTSISFCHLPAIFRLETDCRSYNKIRLCFNDDVLFLNGCLHD